MEASFEEAFNTANKLFLEKNFSESLSVFDQILAKWLCNPQTMCQIANIFCHIGHPGIAVALNSYALQLLKNSPDIMANLAAALRECHKYDEAIEVGKVALSLAPKDNHALRINIMSNIAGAIVNQGRPFQGIPYANEALALGKKHGVDNPAVQNNAGLLLLEAGQWRRGWELWGRRSEVAGNSSRPRSYPGRLWKGEPVESLVVHGEQGLGDEIMFLGALTLDLRVRVRGRIVIECAERLRSLVARSFPECEVIGSEAEFRGDCEAWIPMGNLASLHPEGKPPKRSCYIEPQPALVREWKEFFIKGRAEFFADRRAILLGVRGGVRSTHEGLRNPPLATFEPLVETAAQNIYSIQYGEEGEEYAKRLGIQHLADAANDVEQQAACIAAADLVIAPQQTCLHLAGAVGTRAWGLISSRPAWRYGVKGPMPWYETVELFRAQPKPGSKDDDWNALMRRVVEKLNAYYR